MSRKNYKPGQLITIDGIVYRIIRCKPDTPFYPFVCDGCAFTTSNGYCILPMININCWDSIPKDCYFVRVSPVIKYGFRMTI